MYFDEHNPPHFHVTYNEYNATISINELEIIKGDLPRKARNLVVEWALDNRAALLEDWKLCSQREKPNKIKPLV